MEKTATQQFSPSLIDYQIQVPAHLVHSNIIDRRIEPIAVHQDPNKVSASRAGGSATKAQESPSGFRRRRQRTHEAEYPWDRNHYRSTPESSSINSQLHTQLFATS